MLKWAGRFIYGGISMSEGTLKVKRATTVEEQVDLLKLRNLIVESDEIALGVLTNVNYYRFTGYLLPYKKEDDTYQEGISFTDIYEVYIFDKKLRNLLLMILESIEISLRTHLSNYLGVKYGTLCYRQSVNFINKDRNKDLCKIIDSMIERSGNENMVKHNKEKYGDIPIWTALELSTFKVLSMIYDNMKIKDKKELCKEFYGVNVKYPLLSNWLHVLTVVRNICAHFGRLYSRDITTNVRIPYKYKDYGLEDNRLFAVLIAIKYLAPNREEYKDFVSKLAKIITKSEKIDISMLGFPVNWYEILIKEH